MLWWEEFEPTFGLKELERKNAASQNLSNLVWLAEFEQIGRIGRFLAKIFCFVKFSRHYFSKIVWFA